jgi:plasmid stabilization system protein ParE
MTFSLEITITALMELQEAFDWLWQYSPKAAEKWQSGLLQAIESLAENPLRYPLAHESASLEKEIREMLHGKRRRVFRILYEIREQTVYVVRIRHGARKFLDEE